MRVVIVEDDKQVRGQIRKCLETLEIIGSPEWLESGKFGDLEREDLARIDLLVLDREIHGKENSWEWLAEKCRSGDLPRTILVSGKSDAESFSDYEQRLKAIAVCKHPPDQFASNLKKAAERLLAKEEMQDDIRAGLIEIYDQSMLTREKDRVIVGICDSMLEVQRKVKRYAAKDFPVLITGPTGSGKELVARQLHNGSPRRDKNFRPFVTQELPAGLVASELLGAKRGHFTGGDRDIVGILEEVNGGTLFLDEIADMPADTQVLFLRFLEDKAVRKIGERAAKNMDIRIIAATNKNLREEVEAGRVREDLYYRLASAQIEIPGLIRRSERDIDLLLEHFIRDREEGEKKDVGTYRISRVLREQLSPARYPWPGNIREFRNCVFTALAYGDDGARHPMITAYHLPEYIRSPVATTIDKIVGLFQKLVALEPEPIRYARIEELQDMLEAMLLKRVYAGCKRWSELCDKCGMEKDTLRKPSKMNERRKKIYRQATGDSGETH